ncbi:MAG: Crp/Fnr family transcriptional regulator [Hydrogenophilales bacterium]|nr:Crp/Fnr family transcriptional regulator [Hydrogenophilales bacterium]
MSNVPTRNDLDTLRKTYLFAGLEDEEYDQVSRHASIQLAAAGQSLFTQGDPVNAIFWVNEGLVRLYRSSPQGDEKVIELASPGRFFAEAALFMGGRYPVNAAAQVETRLIAIDAHHFKAWLSQDTNRCFRLLAGMSARLHRLVNDIDRLTLMKGTDRLLQYLLDHSDPDEAGRPTVELEAPKQVIASRIGVKPETLSRLFHKLSDQGYIEVKASKVVILDAEGARQAQID